MSVSYNMQILSDFFNQNFIPKSVIFEDKDVCIIWTYIIG